MPDRRPARYACVVAVLVALTSAAVGGVIPSRGHHRAAATASVRDSRSTLPAASDGSSGDAAALPAASTSPTEPAAVAVPAPAAKAIEKRRTMSFDAPIQGGLSAHQEQALSARLISTHRDAGTAPQSGSWTPALGLTAVARAASWIGMPYSWAGGNASGPTPGRCVPGDGGDLDCHVVGFDCSGLTMYAWGPYLGLPHLASAQLAAGLFHPSLKQLLPGDLVFFSGYLSGGTGHVAVYAGDGAIIEAPQSGSVVTRSTLATALAEDGTYRGAVRPLTGATPTLDAPRTSVPLAGGTLTLHGHHLAGVDAVHVDGVAIDRFVHHSDSTLTVRVPGHRAGRVTVTVTTSWQDTSRPVTATYARPRETPPTPAAPPTPADPPTTVSSSPSPKPSPSPPPTPSPKPSPAPSTTGVGSPSSAAPSPTG